MKKEIAPREEDELVDFKTINEGWSQYELEDDSIMKTKFVLINVIRRKVPSKEGAYQASFNSQNVVGVYSPMKRRGPPGLGHYSIDELRKHIVEQNLKFKQIVDGGWNEYETDSSIILIRNILRRVDKTSLFDSAGMPAYLVNFETEVIVKPKAKPEAKPTTN